MIFIIKRSVMADSFARQNKTVLINRKDNKVIPADSLCFSLQDVSSIHKQLSFSNASPHMFAVSGLTQLCFLCCSFRIQIMSN